MQAAKAMRKKIKFAIQMLDYINHAYILEKLNGDTKLANFIARVTARDS